MVDLELWKDEILDSIKDLHDETKLIRKYLEGEQDVQDDQDDQEEQNVQDHQDDQEEQDEQEDQDDPEQDEQEDQDDPEQDAQEGEDFQEVIIEKLDDINHSINILNKTVVEGSLVVSISIIIALAFHYFMNQISKW